MNDRIPDDPRIAHGGGQDDVQCPECDGTGALSHCGCCDAPLESAGPCPACGESSLTQCKGCEGAGELDVNVLRKRQREARAEYLADLRRDEDDDR